jgi:hypothetical protein
MSKTLVLYVFHIFNERCQNFIDKCIFKDPNVDFIMISNNKNIHFDTPLYVKKFFRDNIGYDFGGWSDALLTNNLYEKYNHFIFVNSSIIGPFLRDDFKGKWTDIYLNGLKGDIKLFGTAINTMGDPKELSHVQSYIFAVHIDSLKYLIDEDIFSITNYAKSFDETIKYKEVLMSRKIIEKGWNIGSLFLLYQDVDFRFKTKQPKNYNIKFLDDIMYDKYFGYAWTEYQLVFVKGNRDLKFATPVFVKGNRDVKFVKDSTGRKYYLIFLISIVCLICIVYLKFRSNK